MVRLLMVCIALVAGASYAEAAVSASPLLLDETVSPRDIFERTITITNDQVVPTRVFPSVNEIVLDEGGAIKEFVPPSMSDRSTSVTSWMAFPRGRIELPPGGSSTLTVTFSVPADAKPGLYHAYLGLGTGASRDEAEAFVQRRQSGGVLVRVMVSDTRVEALRLARFTVNRLVVQPEQDAVTYALTNPGDLPVVPTGDIILYNNRGEEVASVPLNTDERPIAPGETVEWTAPVVTSGMFGRYKAFLSLEYGQNRANVYDTAFFYIAPWQYVLALFGGLFMLVLAVVFWWRRTLLPHDEDHHDGYVALHVRPGMIREDHEHDITLSRHTDTP